LGIDRKIVKPEGGSIIDYNEMLDFLREQKQKHNSDTIPLWLLYTEARKGKGWDAKDVRSCLHFLSKRGDIKVTEKWEVLIK
jgi:uncharacterized protein (UPF0335 family)